MDDASITQTRIDEAWADPPGSEPVPRDPRVQVGRLLAGRFRVEGLLGMGGMGEVFEAYDQILDERVAVKVVRTSEKDPEVSSLRLRLEVQLARRVTHANVCRIFDLFQEPSTDGLPALDLVSMELLQGETLAQRLKAHGRLDLEEALPLVRQIARGLHAAHRTGIVHRDLKPGNVMLIPEVGGVRVAITDFGLARREAQRKRDPDGDPGKSGPRETVAGTPAYMAPEQISGEALSPATDIYSLGIIFYETLAGALPFEGASVWEMSVKRLTESPIPLADRVPDLDPRALRIVERCLEREPAERFRDTSELLENLDFGDSSWNAYGLKAASDTYPRPEELVARRSGRSSGRWLLGLAGMTLVAALGYGWMRGAESTQASWEGAVAPAAEPRGPELRSPAPRPAAAGAENGPEAPKIEGDPFLRAALNDALWSPEVDPGSAEAALDLYHLGRIRQDQGQLEEAIVLLRDGYRELEAAGDFRHGVLARVELALLLERLARIDDMLAALPEEVPGEDLELDPQILGMFLAIRALGLRHAGRAFEAVRVLERAAQLDIRGTLRQDLLRLEAETALVRDQSGKALDLAGEMDGAYAARTLAAEAAARSGRTEEALERLGSDTTFSGRLLRAELSWSLGDVEAAREAFLSAGDSTLLDRHVGDRWRLGILECRLGFEDDPEAATRRLGSIKHQAIALGHLRIASEARLVLGELTRDPDVLHAVAAEGRRHGFLDRAARARDLLAGL